jgi:miniconductance mechanosensitive channel
MSFEAIQNWIITNPYIFFPVVLLLGYLLYRVTRYILARGSYRIALRTETVYDDLIVDQLHPFRVAWLVPLLLIYYYALYAIGPDSLLTNLALLTIIWIGVDFVIALLSGVNEIYRHTPKYSGVSVAGYIGLFKVLIAVIAFVLSLALFADVSPIALLSGVGAWLAVLLLIFRDTILNFMASVQISSQQLVKDGDWIEVPSYGANGFVTEINLNTIKVKNFDNTDTVIPTFKMVDVAYKNWRAMQESGGRRLKKSIILDMSTVKFCDNALFESLGKYDLVAGYIDEKIRKINDFQSQQDESVDFPLDGPYITNVELFMEYIRSYLRSRKDIHQKRLPFVIRMLEPSSRGLPIEIFVFTKTTVWPEFEAIQGDIMIHLLAATPYFDLRIYQEAYGKLDKS